MLRPARPLLIVAALLAVLVASGCAGAPSRLGAAAVVGDRVVPTSLIQERLRTAGPTLRNAVDQRAAQSGGPAGAPIPASVLADRSRALVSIAVQHELITARSARDGIVVPPAAVDQAIASSGGLDALTAQSGLDPASVRDVLGDGLAVVEIGRRSVDGLAVTVQTAAFAERAGAEAFLARASAGPDAAQAAFAEVGAQTGRVPVLLRPGLAAGPDAPGGPDSVSAVAYGLPAGALAMVPGIDGPGSDSSLGRQAWTVLRVLDRTTAAPPAGAPAAAAGSSALAELGLRVVGLTAIEEGVTVSPRYGTWDPAQLAVVGSPAEAGVVRTPAPAAAP